jgi:transglutaminase-like putative cysteine protease
MRRRQLLWLGVQSAAVVLGKPAPRSRQVLLTYTVKIGAIPAGRRVELWLPVPHDDANQRIEQLRISAPHGRRILRGEYQNQYLHCFAGGDTSVQMSFRGTRFERVQPLSPSGAGVPRPECCLSAERLVPLDQQIRQWARDVVGSEAQSDLEKARAIYHHVIATVKYDKSGKGWGRGDIYYACDARRGNCTDFHAIFIGYCRAVGVPARFAIGVPLPASRGAGEIAGYHCWAEFFAEGIGWVPVDASEAAKDPSKREYFFGAHDENRIEFSRGRDLILNPRQKGEPLNFFVYPYAELDGQPFQEVTTSITFRDLS